MSIHVPPSFPASQTHCRQGAMADHYTSTNTTPALTASASVSQHYTSDSTSESNSYTNTNNNHNSDARTQKGFSESRHHITDTSHDRPSATVRSSITAGAPTLSKTETVLCGATAGVVARFVIAPLDVVKIRLQMQTQRKDLSSILKRKPEVTGAEIMGTSAAKIQKQQQQPKYRGMISGMTMIVREEGVRGLWKGNMAAEYLYLTYSGIQFLVYQQTKVFLAKTADLSAQKAAEAARRAGPSKLATGTVVAAPLSAVSKITSSSAVQSFIAGANAGIVATACTYPFDLLRTRFAVQRDVKVYTGIVQACQHIYYHDGIRGLYRGMSPALIQVVPYMGLMFGSYDTLKRVAAWLKYKAHLESSYSTSASSSPLDSAQAQQHPLKSVSQALLGLEDLVCGALSGIISKTGVYPLDMVRKRLQIQGSEQQKSIAGMQPPSGAGFKAPESRLPTTVWRCMVRIVRMEGYLALYKGLLPGLIKAAPASAMTFLVFSQAGAFVERVRGRREQQQE